jgi:L-alanine-DL-glutamate epimerase-like enolase superfamily enzyme
MPKIVKVRPVLLSSPYADAQSQEVRIHLPAGFKTCGLVEITLDTGQTGLGEGYLAVFAPHVFAEIVKLVTPNILGKEAFDIQARYRDLCLMTDYWSLQGAARHVVSAIEIALVDAKAKELNVPAYSLFGGKAVDSIELYGSGGDSLTPQAMQRELEALRLLGLRIFKIRARNHEIAKTVWVLEQAGSKGIQVGVDMIQNLANPAQTVSDVVRFVSQVHGETNNRVLFLEEALGPFDIQNYRLLRSRIDTKICGGETLTTAAEMCYRVENRTYDFVQPDATVIGGLGQTLEVFATCRHHGSQVVVHCWGGAVGTMANYHAAFAGGGQLVEWPMPEFPLRRELFAEPLRIERGCLLAPRLPGLGVRLTPEIEARFPFREDAVYSCSGDRNAVPAEGNWG